jgi:signal peptidase I
MLRQSAGWLAGLVIVAGVGWGFIYLAWHLARDYKLIGPEGEGSLVVVAIAAAVSLAVFVLLERHFWLSRLSGFQVGPGSHPLRSAVFLWLFGVVWMFVRGSLETPPQHTKEAKPPPPGHAPRETIETIVFVVVLVFLLKQFVVEAFVIPTGSMAETLYGYQKIVDCPECGYEFPLNASWEMDPPPGEPRRAVEGFCCPNCRFKSTFGPQQPPPFTNSGDRVLVHKAMQHLDDPEPGDVVVFKFPEAPQRLFSAQNYIKRMWGVGGDTIAIWRGDLYVCKSLTYPLPPDARPEDLWHRFYTFENSEEAVKKFEESRAAGFPVGVGGFELLRKSDEVALAMRRIVFDNDRQSRTLTQRGYPPRWKAETADWSADSPTAPRVFTHTGSDLGWVRYRHLAGSGWGMPNQPVPTMEPRPVDNFLGYNAEVTPFGEFRLDRGAEDHKFWVGDLMLECRVTITDPTDRVILELSKGPNRFQAIFADGTVTLRRTGLGGAELGNWPTRMTRAGTYDLRFANFDCRLRVWVDGRPVPLGPQADYSPILPNRFDPADTKREGWTTANDVEAPASVGAAGGVEVSRLKLWRDSYFINNRFAFTTDVTATVSTFYVQPDHYLCLGDNSAQSSDGREWGTVPERLMLGRAVFVFWPRDRIGFIK